MEDLAILFLVFNRPDVTEKAFDSIRQTRPSRLYVAADGPRAHILNESEIVSKVCEIATQVDWDCELKTLFRKDNLGCKVAVSSAITWFFEHEGEGVILEDDCIPDKSFFPFCEQLLAHYRNDTRIMAISGNNFQKGRKRTTYSYYYSRIPHCWGWATWKRAWELWDGSLYNWPTIRDERFLSDIADGDELFVNYWQKIFNECHIGSIDSWAYPWTFSCWIQSGLTILPNVNLVTNIGFDERATHTKNTNDKNARLPSQVMAFPLLHPPYVIRDRTADIYTDKTVYGITEKTRSLRYRIGQKIQDFYDKK